MLVKPARDSNLAPLSSNDAKIVRYHIWEALIRIPRHRHNKGVNPADCDNCVMLNHLINASKLFKRIGE